jgi:hypothetical protein
MEVVEALLLEQHLQTKETFEVLVPLLSVSTEEVIPGQLSLFPLDSVTSKRSVTRPGQKGKLRS